MTTADRYVDVSSNNARGDLQKYRGAGHRKISVKVSEGTGYHWYGSEDLIDQSHRLGLTVQHYHWLRPDQDAITQAKFFLGWVGKRFKRGDDLMNDFELTYKTPDGSDAHRAEQLAAFNEYVQARIPQLCVYTGNWYAASKGPHSQAELRRWPVVMSDYSGAATLPNPYGLNYVAWQFTDRARVSGWPEPLDYNRTLVPASAPAPSSGSSHPIPIPTSTGTSTAEAADMYEILYDEQSKVWYAWAPGYWRRIGSQAELEFMAARGLCRNGADVRKVLATPAKKRAAALAAFGFSNGHVLTVKTFATKG